MNKTDRISEIRARCDDSRPIRRIDVKYLLDRLAAYEDTGLEPEEIKQVQVALDKIPFGRFYEIMQAERDGRCVVLPCKVGKLSEKLKSLRKPFGDSEETYTTGYRNGYNNGQAELLEYLLQVDTGERAEAEAALQEGAEHERD
jgi:hypothetical protein